MIFDHFAMQDVYKLTPYIVKWLSLCLLYVGNQFQEYHYALTSCLQKFENQTITIRHMNSEAMQELNGLFADGIVMSVVFLLFVQEPSNTDRSTFNLRPDPRTLFLCPVSRQEYVHNLQTVAAICQRLNVPVYL